MPEPWPIGGGVASGGALFPDTAELGGGGGGIFTADA